jgi:hypothetical protein
MKTALKLCLVYAIAFGATRASAYDNLSGAVCQANYGYFADQFMVTVAGLENFDLVSRNVDCPVKFTSGPTGAVGVYVDGNNQEASTSSCTLFSYSYNGTLLGYASSSRTNQGAWEMYLVLPAGQATTWAYLTVECALPHLGSIVGVTTNAY